MKTIPIIFMFFSIMAFAQDSWHFKSSQDDFTVTAGDQLTIGGTPIANKRVFDDFLKILLKSNRGECPTLGDAQLTVEAKTTSSSVTKKFYPVEGAIESNGKCSDLDYDTGWSLPFHRDWFSNDSAGKIDLGDTMAFKSSELGFTLTKKENVWISTSKGFVPDLLRMTEFAKAVENFKIEKRYSKKAKENSRSSFTLTTNAAKYKFYHINGAWAIEAPKSSSLIATKDFPMIGRFARSELGDNRSDDLNTLANKGVAVKERQDLLEKMSNVDSQAFKNTLHMILKDPAENIRLKEQVALLLIDRPSGDNVRAVMTLLEKGSAAEKVVASKALRRLNSGGPLFSEEDGDGASEKLKKWREWYSRYSKATGN